MTPYDYRLSDVEVHQRIWRRHKISENDIREAWRNSLELRVRPMPRNDYGDDEYMTIGFDHAGRAIELVATYDEPTDTFLVYHANRPATDGFAIEYEAIGVFI